MVRKLSQMVLSLQPGCYLAETTPRRSRPKNTFHHDKRSPELRMLRTTKCEGTAKVSSLQRYWVDWTLGWIYEQMRCRVSGGQAKPARRDTDLAVGAKHTHTHLAYTDCLSLCSRGATCTSSLLLCHCGVQLSS